MSREWKPGEIAMVQWSSGGAEMPMMRGTRSRWFEKSGSFSEEHVKSVRPLVVIDPEDADAVGRLRDALHPHLVLASNLLSKWQNGLREFAEPPCEVFEHYPRETPSIYGHRSLCGKVWDPSDKTVSVGKCPECVALVESRWVK